MSFGKPQSIQVKFSNDEIQNMLNLSKAAPFPDKAPIDCDTPWKLGIDYQYLKNLKTKFETEWSWETLEKKIAKYDNYLIHYENGADVLDLHYVHVKSSRSDAIPLMLLHGWPGTFFDFHKVIDSLVNPPSAETPAFHVVVPSLPGYFLSTLSRRDGFGPHDIAKLFNGLMTEALGYSKYTAQGGDWGSLILRVMASTYPESVSLSHYNMFVAPVDPNVDPSTYSEVDKRYISKFQEFSKTGNGYYVIQSTKPFTIGIAIASSPFAIITYIGEKIHGWSDPNLVDPQDILDTSALYYLSRSFPTSVMMYNQAGLEFLNLREPGKLLIKNKFGFSAFPFELGGAPRSGIATVGPLAYYKEHTSGGHFAALDVPKEFVEDLREFFGQNWRKSS
ncbi:alpha beta-hydrolase [Pyrrhoderma noxium]|uniref:Alpha beta-hydrolase n=1 Tax=Pyrrhoderma noxium TaxID=2282107 RepID=A0A286UEV8_9AGAM|nr:alpha beta-hydrolase [Pyrrhoderma noxium]